MKNTDYQSASEIVLFGALGDLSRRKLLPALYQLDQVGLLNPESRIVAVARQEMSLDTSSGRYRGPVRQTLER